MNWSEFLFGNGVVAGKEIEHPQLGKIVADTDGYWIGHQVVGGDSIEITIDGAQGTVEPNSANYCSVILASFPIYFQAALDAIASELSISPAEAMGRFKPSSLFSITNNGDATFFYMGLIDRENEFALWRVQFENERPTSAGFDS